MSVVAMAVALPLMELVSVETTSATNPSPGAGCGVCRFRARLERDPSHRGVPSNRFHRQLRPVGFAHRREAGGYFGGAAGHRSTRGRCDVMRSSVSASRGGSRRLMEICGMGLEDQVCSTLPRGARRPKMSTPTDLCSNRRGLADVWVIAVVAIRSPSVLTTLRGCFFSG